MIGQLTAKYQFEMIHTADIISTDGKVTNRALIPPNLRYSAVYACPPPREGSIPWYVPPPPPWAFPLLPTSTQTPMEAVSH